MRTVRGVSMTEMHTLENHNYHIKMYGRCPYCMMGSEPVPKVMIVEAVNDGHESKM